MHNLDRLPTGEFRYPYLSPSELVGRLEEKAVLYLPMGSLEWHNEHLPLGTDAFHAIELAARLADRIGGVSLPAFWWNTGDCHDHETTYHMPEDLYRAALKSVCLGLRSIPARLLVLVNGHGGGYQRNSPQAVADELNSEGFPMRVLRADPFNLALDSPMRLDHADTRETSFAMEMIPQLVRMERGPVRDLLTGKTPFAGGRPAAEGGRALWEAYLKDATEVIERAYDEA